MAVVRVEKTKDYTVMSNYHLKDKNLSLKAKGLLSLMLSLPDNWDYSIVGLCKICCESVNTINGIIHELEDAKYMKRNRIYEKGKIKDWEYVIYESPDLYLKNEDIEKQDIENLDIENKGQLNTNKSNTNELNKYKYIVDYLNMKAGTKYKASTPKTQSLIRARINEKFSVQDFEKVIANMVTKWKGTPMEQYLRPETLFGTKFEGYLNIKLNTKEQINNSYRQTMDNLYDDVEKIL